MNIDNIANDQNILYRNTMPRNSLTHLGGLSGAPDNSYIGDSHDSDSNYGAEFKYINIKSPYYEPIISQRVSPGWLAEKQEQTFMNILKAKNEPPVKTYADLKLSSIPDQQYETYEPVIYTTQPNQYIQFNNCNKCNKSTHFNNYNHYNIEPFKSSKDLDIRSETDTDVGVGFIFKVILIIIVFIVIYYLLKQK